MSKPENTLRIPKLHFSGTTPVNHYLFILQELVLVGIFYNNCDEYKHPPSVTQKTVNFSEQQFKME